MITTLKVLAFLLICVAIVAEGLIYKISSPEWQGLSHPKSVQQIVLLGNGSDTTNGALKDRILRAVEAHKIFPFAKIVITGNSKRNEIEPVKQELVRHGVPAEQITADEKASSTWDSAMNSLDFVPSMSSEVIVITNDFHLGRAVASFRTAGVKAYPFGRDSASYPEWVWYFLREGLSRIKWLYQYSMHKYLSQN